MDTPIPKDRIFRMSKKQREKLDTAYTLAKVEESIDTKIAYLKGLLGYTRYAHRRGKYRPEFHLAALERAYFLEKP